MAAKREARTAAAEELRGAVERWAVTEDTRNILCALGLGGGVSISYAVVHFANKAGISQAEAEAVLAQLKPADGHRANALLAQQAFARFAKSNGIPVTGAISTMREWADGRE